MKKLTAILLILALCLSGCGKEDDSQASPAASQMPDTPSVRFLTTIPGTQKSFRTLAKAYTEQTGIPVEIISAGDEDLPQLLAGPEAPTAFTAAAGQLPLAYALPLDGSKLAEELLTQEFSLRHPDGTLAALPLELGVYGILVNVTLLRQAGFTPEDIHSFDTLKAVAEDIQSRSVTLGFDAFTAAGLSPSSLRFSGQLVSLPLYYELREAGVTETPPPHLGHRRRGPCPAPRCTRTAGRPASRTPPPPLPASTWSICAPFLTCTWPMPRQTPGFCRASTTRNPGSPLPPPWPYSIRAAAGSMQSSPGSLRSWP